MSESTKPARCSDAEYRMAREAGLLVVTTKDEIAIHLFAEAIRKSMNVETDQHHGANAP